jgi:phosphohistidine phosphatase SixA
MHTQTVHEQPTPLRRVIRRSTNWTLKEHEVVVSHWPDVDAIAKQLPHRTRRACPSSGFLGQQAA